MDAGLAYYIGRAERGRKNTNVDNEITIIHDSLNINGVN